MIKLTRAVKPTFLTDERVAELTARYKTSSESVWNIPEIKDPLLASGSGKCAYCEADLTSESHYMEVEHFEDKSRNPDKVVEWKNLLPSCKKCNGSKGTHDVISSPIVNPYEEDPKDHLAMRLYRFRPKTEKGEISIDVVGLNHSERLVQTRFLIGEKVTELIVSASEKLILFQDRRDTRSKNRLVSSVEGLLVECNPKSAYSATTATILTTDSNFISLIAEMRSEQIWTDELQDAFEVACANAMDVV